MKNSHSPLTGSELLTMWFTTSEDRNLDCYLFTCYCSSYQTCNCNWIN